MIEFVVPGKPVPWTRPRIGGRKNGKTWMVTAAHDHPIHVYKQMVALFARQAKPGGPLYEKLRIDLVFVLPSGHVPVKEKGRPRSWAAVRPDLDNLVKAVLDALNGVLFVDDAQIVMLSAAKHRAADGEGPSTSVRIDRVEDKPKRRRQEAA